MADIWQTLGGIDTAALLAKTDKAASSWIWLVVATALGGAWYGLTKWNRSRKGEVGDGTSPKSLLAELEAAHKLSRIERGLLSEAAAIQNLQDPALLFVDSRILKRLSTGPNGAEFSALVQKLFG
jgi:hypothetical protein